MQTLAVRLEALMVPCVTFLVAVTIMGSMGGLAPLEQLLAVVQATAAYFIWTRWAAPR
ncbi:MAG: hypothetical protein H0W96_12795 [Solirubrobacterales bacterium]|nr:hypothetical protein [Solirubrobacterales bacterium]